MADIIEAISGVNLGIKNIQSVMGSESILQDKEKFTAMAVAITQIRERVHFLSSRLGGFQLAMPQDIDERGSFTKNREFELFDMELHSIGDIAGRLSELLHYQ